MLETGQPWAIDFRVVPHWLNAGATQSGKSNLRRGRPSLARPEPEREQTMSRTRRAASAVLDSGPVLILAAIAGAGSFAHIRDTATQHGQHGPMSWAIAVCIDLTCVMAARERHRDKHTRRRTGRLSWPTIVLAGGVLLSLAAGHMPVAVIR